MKAKPTVHLMCGLPGAGKTIFAGRLAAEQPAVCFTLDIWMLRLYDYTIFDPEYGLYVEHCKELIWETGQQVLACGNDIILDWSLWNRERRRRWHRRILSAGYQHRLYYFKVPLTELRARLAARNREQPTGTHVISEAELLRFAPLFEAPSADEGLTIVEVSRRPWHTASDPP